MDVLRAVRPTSRTSRWRASWLALPPDPEQHADALPALHEGGNSALAALERRLSGRNYLVGDSLTIADIALYGYTHVADEGGFDLGRYPAVQAWIARVAAEPGHITIDA